MVGDGDNNPCCLLNRAQKNTKVILSRKDVIQLLFCLKTVHHQTNRYLKAYAMQEECNTYHPLDVAELQF